MRAAEADHACPSGSLRVPTERALACRLRPRQRVAQCGTIVPEQHGSSLVLELCPDKAPPVALVEPVEAGAHAKRVRSLDAVTFRRETG